jgi:hypothetical protein
MKNLLDCAELASKHESTRRLFGVMWDAAQAQRKVQLHMLAERFPERMVDIVRTRADEWDRMTVRLIEQEAAKLDKIDRESDPRPDVSVLCCDLARAGDHCDCTPCHKCEQSREVLAAIEARSKPAERTAERPKLSPLPPETYPGLLQAKNAEAPHAHGCVCARCEGLSRKYPPELFREQFTEPTKEDVQREGQYGWQVTRAFAQNVEPDAEHGTESVWEYRAFECKQHATCPHFRPHKSSVEWNCLRCYVMRRGLASANAVEQEAR